MLEKQIILKKKRIEGNAHVDLCDRHLTLIKANICTTLHK